MDDTDDLHTPDESRPAKRVRLEASLGVTADTQEEMMDDDDWDDVYGGAADEMHDVESTPVVALDSSNGQSQTTSNGQASDLAAPPAIVDGQAADASQTESSAQIDNGIPAEAIADGDDLVAPGPVMEGLDAPSARILQENAQIEVKPQIESAPVEVAESNALNRDSTAPHSDVKAGSNGEVNAQESKNPISEASEAVHPNAKLPMDPEFLTAAAAQKGNKAAEWQFDSSDAESSSDSDSSDSDDSSDADSDSDGGYEMLDPATAARFLMSGDGDDDDGERGKGKSGADHQPRTMNEVADAAVPKPDVVVTPDMQITLLGTVERTVENMALIKGATPGEYQVLESGSVLCNASREVIGAVAETFGRVQEPMYSIAFSNTKEIEDAGLQYGTNVYYVDSHSTFVFTQPLKNLKGTDASNIHDEEVGEDEIEFSDDEKEAEYKRQKKLAKKAGRGGLSRSAFNESDGGRNPSAANHDGGTPYFLGGSDAPAQTYGGGMSYDDNEEPAEEFYQPLKRPDNLSHLMASGPPLPRPQPSFDRGRGRGRGDRGRSDRGRGRGDRGRGRGGFDGHGHRGGRGGMSAQLGQVSGHRGNAQSFPDHHNHRASGWQKQSLPSKPDAPQGVHSASSQSTSNQFNWPQNQATQQSQTYQFNDYTFQYGTQPPAAVPQGYTPQQHQYPTQQSAAQSSAIPAGAYVNPAFFQQQQQQQSYGAWGAPPLAQPATQQHQQQPYQQFNAATAAATAAAPGTQRRQQKQQQQQQPANLADILRRLGGPQGQ